MSDKETDKPVKFGREPKTPDNIMLAAASLMSLIYIKRGATGYFNDTTDILVPLDLILLIFWLFTTLEIINRFYNPFGFSNDVRKEFGKCFTKVIVSFGLCALVLMIWSLF